MKIRFGILLFCVCQALGCIREDYAHSSYFYIKQGFRLVGHLIRTTFADGLLACVQFCLREQLCASLNYQDNFEGEGVCELNSENATTSALIHDESCNYVTMECVEKIVSKPKVKSLFFPFASTSNYVMLRDVITSPLAALTLCFWMRTNDTTNDGTPFSYSAEAAGGKKNELLMISYKNFLFHVHDAPAMQTRLSATDGKWHHICSTWESTSGSWALYKDGQPKAQGASLSQGNTITPGGIIVLGQDQDSDGGGFQLTQSFIGEMANVNIWSRDLAAAEIFQMSSSCALGCGDVMNWTIAIGKQTAGVQVVSSASCV